MQGSRRAALQLKPGSGRTVTQRSFNLTAWDGELVVLAPSTVQDMPNSNVVGAAHSVDQNFLQQAPTNLAADQSCDLQLGTAAAATEHAKQRSPQVIKRIKSRRPDAPARAAPGKTFTFDGSALQDAIDAIIRENAQRQAAQEAARLEAAAAEAARLEAAAAEAARLEAAAEKEALAAAQEQAGSLGGSSSQRGPASAAPSTRTKSSLAFTPVEGVPERRLRSAAKPAAAASSGSFKTPYGRTPMEGVPEKFSMFRTPATRMYRFDYTPMEGVPERCVPFANSPLRARQQSSGSNAGAAPAQLFQQGSVGAASGSVGQGNGAAGSSGGAAAAGPSATPPRSVDEEMAVQEGAADDQQQAQTFVDRLCQGLLQVSPQTPVPSHISGEEQEQEQQQQAGAASGGRCEVMIQTGISLRNMTYMNSPAQGAAAGQQQQQARSQSQGQAPSDEQRRRSMRSAGNQAQQHEQHVARPAAAAGASQSGSAGAAASKSSAGSAGSTGAARSGAAGAAVAAVASADLDQPGFNRTTNTPASAELADEAAAGPSGHQQQTEQQHSDGAAAAAAAMHYDDDDGGDFGGGDDGWHHDDDDDDEEQQHGDHQQPAAHAASEQRRSGGAAAEHVDEEEEEDEGGNENDAAAANQGGRRGGKRPRMSEVNMREKNAYKKRKSLAGEGMVTDDGVRRSRRTRYRPLEYWRNEKKNYNRKFKSLPTVEGVVTRTPVPMWPMTAGNRAKTKRRRQGRESEER